MSKLIFIVLFISSFTQANENTDFDNFIESFYYDFSQRNLKKVSVEYFHKNVQFIFGEHIMAPGSATEIESVFHSIIESLEKDGYQKSVIKDIDKNFTGSSYVVATIFFDRFKTNNEKLDSMCSTYSAAKLEGKWKILTWLPSKPVKENSCF
jgi:hypothetical protein